MSKALWCFTGTALVSARAQDPPKMLRIIREDIKEGKSPAHECFVSLAETLPWMRSIDPVAVIRWRFIGRSGIRRHRQGRRRSDPSPYIR